MDETPKIIGKITEQKIIEETIKKQKRDIKVTKIANDGIPEGIQKKGIIPYN